MTHLTHTRRIAKACVIGLLTMASMAAGMMPVPASAQQLQAKFSCSADGDDGGERVIYADQGEFRIEGDRIDTFRWESSLFRSTHGFDCSIDTEDGLKAEFLGNGQQAWRVSVTNPEEARFNRGYDFATRMTCAIRLVREGDTLQIRPTCPALCGSRMNFSALEVNLKTGECAYDNAAPNIPAAPAVPQPMTMAPAERTGQ